MVFFLVAMCHAVGAAADRTQLPAFFHNSYLGLSAGYADKYYTQALKVRRLIRQDYDEAFKAVGKADQVLMVSSGDGGKVTIGKPIVAGAKVTGQIVEHGLPMTGDERLHDVRVECGPAGGDALDGVDELADVADTVLEEVPDARCVVADELE